MTTKKYSDFPNGGEIQQNDQVVGLRAGANTRFDFPGQGIRDGNSNYMFKYKSGGAGATNFPELTNAIAGQPVGINSDGPDTNIDFLFNLKGSGQVLVPTPTKGSAATTKDYVDSIINDSNYSLGARAATTANFSSVYDNGASGFGATLTASANGAASIDGVVLDILDFILFKDQTSPLENGLYFLSTNGDGSNPSIFTRSFAFDSLGEIKRGELIGVVEGTENSSVIFQQTERVISVGISSILFQIGSVDLPVSVTDQAIPRFDGITGKKMDASLVTISDVGQVLSPVGGLGTPTYSFSIDPTTGMFSETSGEISFTSAGVEIMEIISSGVNVTGNIGLTGTIDTGTIDGGDSTG